MFDYKFVSIKAKGIFSLDFEHDYKNVVQENAKEGWRFIQLVPVEYNNYGVPKQVEVVLERPSEWDKIDEVTV